MDQISDPAHTGAQMSPEYEVSCSLSL